MKHISDSSLRSSLCCSDSTSDPALRSSFCSWPGTYGGILLLWSSGVEDSKFPRVFAVRLVAE